MHTSPSETASMILHSQPSLDKPWNSRYAILLRPHAIDDPFIAQEIKPKMIGVVGLPREAEIGYKINEQYWGKGYMTEALTLFLDFFWSLEGNFLSYTLLTFHL